MECSSTGQVLIPSSFEVKTFLIDGSNGAFEEILDPDFGESALGVYALLIWYTKLSCMVVYCFKFVALLLHFCLSQMLL